jgi:hypothetical protein
MCLRNKCKDNKSIIRILINWLKVTIKNIIFTLGSNLSSISHDSTPEGCGSTWLFNCFYVVKHLHHFSLNLNTCCIITITIIAFFTLILWNGFVINRSTIKKRKEDKLENTKGLQEIVNGRRTDNTTVKRKKTKGQTMIYKALHRKLRIVQHEPHWKSGINSCASKGHAVVPAPRVVHVVLLLL